MRAGRATNENPTGRKSGRVDVFSLDLLPGKETEI
jgi:hypothetical protein